VSTFVIMDGDVSYASLQHVGPATGTPTWRESVHHGVSQLRPTGTTATTGKSVALSLSPTLTGARSSAGKTLTTGRSTRTTLTLGDSNSESLSGARVGKGKWLCEAALFTYWTHVGSAYATTETLLVSMDVLQTARLIMSQELINELYHSYALIYHRHLMAARPPRSQYPDDLFVPFTRSTDIMLLLDHGMQVLMAQAVLQSTLSRSAFDQVMFDVQSGYYSILYDEAGNIGKVAPFASLKIINYEGLIFSVLGRVDGEHIRAGARLPGIRQSTGETPQRAWVRLLENDLSRLKDGIQLSDIVESDFVSAPTVVDDENRKRSHDRGSQHSLLSHTDIPTHYWRTVRTGAMTADYWEHVQDQLPLIMPQLGASQRISVSSRKSRRLPSQRSHSDRGNVTGGLQFFAYDVASEKSFPTRQVFLLKGVACAWLDEEELSHYMSVSGCVDLQRWLYQLQVPRRYSPGVTARSSFNSHGDASSGIGTVTGEVRRWENSVTNSPASAARRGQSSMYSVSSNGGMILLQTPAEDSPLDVESGQSPVDETPSTQHADLRRSRTGSSSSYFAVF